MSRFIVIEQFHVTVLVSRDLPEARCLAMRGTLERTSLKAEIRSAIRTVFGRYPSLSVARIRLSV